MPALFPGFAEPGRWLPLLERHAALVAEAGPRVRVTSVAPADAIQRHYAESLEILRLILDQETPEIFADVGSGGGYPGLVVAAVFPGVAIHLVEPLQKRARVLVEWARALGLTNVSVHAERAEDAGRGTLRNACNIVTARAVTALPALLEYTVPLARSGGIVALPKGAALAEELEASGRALAALNAGVLGTARMREEISMNGTVLFIRASGPTPPELPRRAGVPQRRPL